MFCSDRSIKRWLTILENMYIVFKVTPYHRNIARSLSKAPKYFFYDVGQVIGDPGIKLENLTAILKECHFLEDSRGEQLKLYYLRTRDGRELDFFVTRDEEPFLGVEVKWGAAMTGRRSRAILPMTLSRARGIPPTAPNMIVSTTVYNRD